MHSYEEAHKHSIDYFEGDELAASVFIGKYALKNHEGEYIELTPEDMHKRIAKEFARIESKYENSLSEKEIFDLLDRFKYIVPQGSPMSGIGNDFKIQSLSNCFVIEPPFDSYGGILKTDQEQVQIMKRRGGVGFDISTIRPKGISTSNAAKTTDGIEVFMDRFSNSCREVAQGGRRGALMITIDVRHPQIRDFVKIKRDLTRVTGANISIRLTDEFMSAVRGGGKFQLQWPVDSNDPDVIVLDDAKEIWHEIIESAHASAEPGLLFWDTAKKNTPSDVYEKEGFGSVSTNPCGEIILSPYDSCRLMLVNLTSFVKDAWKDKSEFDYGHFAQVVQKAQRLMDNMIDLEIEQIDKIIQKIEKDPEPDEVKQIEINLWYKIKRAAVRGRRTGLGITGLGDTLAMLNIQYGSEESIKITEEIYKWLALNSYESSIQLAKERGSFPVFDYTKEKDKMAQRLGWFKSKVHHKDPRIRAEARSALTTATAFNFAVMTGVESGMIEATGGQVSSYQEANGAYVPPYHVKVGGAWVPYRWIPYFGELMAFSTNFRDYSRTEINFVNQSVVVLYLKKEE